MKECIEIYQEFFVTFLSAKAFTGKNDSEFDPNGWLSKMVKRPNDTLEERTKYLEQLLQGSDATIITTEEDQALVDKLKPVSVQLLSGVHTFTEALMLSCQILVELSSIPTMGSNTSSPLGYDFSLLGYGCSPQELPGWLKVRNHKEKLVKSHRTPYSHFDFTFFFSVPHYFCLSS